MVWFATATATSTSYQHQHVTSYHSNDTSGYSILLCQRASERAMDGSTV